MSHAMFCGIIKKKRKEITMVKNKTKEVQYYLDKTDQIEVDGHTLSRLYLAPGVAYPSDSILSRYAVYGENNTNKWMGGYVENVDNLSHNITGRGWIAWVDPDSKVYGESEIGTGCFIQNSTIINSQVRSGYHTSKVLDSTVIDSIVHDVENSRVTNSTCDRLVNNSTLENSNITGPKNSLVVDANLTNVKHHGSISGTFSDIELDDLTVHDMEALVEIPIRSIRSTYYIYPINSFQLLQDTKGNFALTDNASGEYQFGNTKFPVGDVDFDVLYTHLNSDLNGEPIGKPETLKKLDEIKEGMILTDSDLDFGDDLTR